MPRNLNRSQRRRVNRDNSRRSDRLVRVTAENRDELIGPGAPWPKNLMHCYVSSRYFVQVFAENGGFFRISVNRVELGGDNHFVDGIAWDELQHIKREVGFGDRDALEVYPADDKVVDVSSMRHLWIPPESVEWKWGGRECVSTSHRGESVSSGGAE